MIIKNPISTCRFQWMSRFPMLEESIEKDMTDAKGHLDVSKARDILSKYPNIEFSGNDNVRTIAFAVEFLSQIRTVTTHLEQDKSNDIHLSAREDSTVDRRLEDRMDEKRVAYARIVIDEVAKNGLHVPRVRFRVDDPNLLGDSAIKSAKEFCVYVARIFRHIAGAIERSNGGEYVIDIGELPISKGRQDDVGQMLGIVAEAVRLDEREKLKDENAKRFQCERRTSSGHCSPCKFDCPHFKNGECREI